MLSHNLTVVAPKEGLQTAFARYTCRNLTSSFLFRAILLTDLLNQTPANRSKTHMPGTKVHNSQHFTSCSVTVTPGGAYKRRCINAFMVNAACRILYSIKRCQKGCLPEARPVGRGEPSYKNTHTWLI